MGFLLAANVVMLLHYAFLGFAAFGGFLLRWWPAMLWWHVAVVAWGVLIAIIGWTCPLTPLENRLRVAAGSRPYDGGFIEHYIMARWYPEGLPEHIMTSMGVGLLALNVIAYGLWWQAQR